MRKFVALSLPILALLVGCSHSTDRERQLQARIAKLEEALEAERKFSQEREMDIVIPQVVKARPLTSAMRELIVTIDKDGEYSVADHSYSQEELEVLLEHEARSNPSQFSVVIRADERAQIQRLVPVIGLCNKHQIEHSLTTEVAADESSNADLDVDAKAKSDD